MSDAARRFQILSLDGGGIKGLYSAALLARLEEDLGLPDITSCFDLIVGTSTGGNFARNLLDVRPRPKEVRITSLQRSSARIWTQSSLNWLGPPTTSDIC
jgi:patatin-like phospholipase/acyl hydrolase